MPDEKPGEFIERICSKYDEQQILALILYRLQEGLEVLFRIDAEVSSLSSLQSSLRQIELTGSTAGLYLQQIVDKLIGLDLRR
jgi:hypothetical protein